MESNLNHPNIEKSETILAELKVNPILLNDRRELDRRIRRILKGEGIRIKRVGYQFDPWGLTLVYIIGGSHVAIHTYPENRGMSLDIHLCEGDIFRLFDKIREALNPLDYDSIHLVRSNIQPRVYCQGRFFETKVAPGVATRFEVKKLIYEGRTRYQTIHIIENDTLGRALFLDGDLQICDYNFNHYGRMMTLGFKTSRPRSVLILGGGEGQLARYILDHHPFVERIRIVEIDGEAVEIYKKYLPYTEPTLRDPRVELVLANALDYVNNSSEWWDAILLDFTQKPINIPLHVFYKDFIARVTRLTGHINLYVSDLIGWDAWPELRLLRKEFRKHGFKCSFKKGHLSDLGIRMWYGVALRKTR